MPRRNGAKPTGIGKAIDRDREQKHRLGPAWKANGVSDGQAKRSVLEQSGLEDFLASAELVQATPECTRARTAQEYKIVEGPRLVPTVGARAGRQADAAAQRARASVPIPRRPEWDTEMAAEELALAEGQAFLEWRRSLAKMEEEVGLVMTPYEKNLDFWRQLWRCVERSDLLVQILDCRDPEFYRCQDLTRYVVEVSAEKRHLLLLNKADFLDGAMRRRWVEHFKKQGVDVLFFSALRELHRQQRLPATARTGDDPVGGDAGEGGAAPQLPPHGPLQSDDADVADCARLLEELHKRLPPECGEGERRGVVGFVGYPNVGKSSVINALFGAKKVSMSRTPGKTKHLQTLELPGQGLTLCDCPGLVFPSVVATKAHLFINGVAPLDELRDTAPAVRLAVGKVGAANVLEKYGLTAAILRDGATRRGDEKAASLGIDDEASAAAAVERDPAGALLGGLATSRRKFLGHGVPDETWAARRILADYCTGGLLHCEEPPVDDDAPAGGTLATCAGADGYPCGALPPAPVATADGSPAAAAAEGSGDDFSDVEAFLNGDTEGHAARRKGRCKKGRPTRGG